MPGNRKIVVDMSVVPVSQSPSFEKPTTLSEAHARLATVNERIQAIELSMAQIKAQFVDDDENTASSYLHQKHLRLSEMHGFKREKRFLREFIASCHAKTKTLDASIESPKDLVKSLVWLLHVMEDDPAKALQELPSIQARAMKFLDQVRGHRVVIIREPS